MIRKIRTWPRQSPTFLRGGSDRTCDTSHRTAHKDLVQIVEDDWDTVKERIQVEGSDWIVWWMDGAGNLMRKIASGEWSMEEGED